MAIENTGVALVKQAAEALDALNEHGPHLRPTGTDRFAWTADVLDELARVAALMARAVDHASGDECPTVRRQAEALADAIVAHRNTMLQPTATGARDVTAAQRDRSRSATGPQHPRGRPGTGQR